MNVSMPTDHTQVRATLMEFTVLCPANGPVHDWHNDTELACTDCQGSGVLYPLRRECPSETHNPCTKEFGYTVSGMSYYEQIDIPTCASGYVFNDNPDALTEAIRAKGWGVKLQGWLGGDDIVIYPDIENCLKPSIARVLLTEHICGRSAMELALMRAMEAE